MSIEDPDGGDGSSTADPVPSRFSSRLAENLLGLLGGMCGAWLTVIVVNVLSAPQRPTPLAILFAAGAVGLFAGVVLAAAALLISILRVTWTCGLPRWREAAAALGITLATVAVSRLFADAVADMILPAGLDVRGSFIRAGGWCVSAGVGAAAGSAYLLTSSQRRRSILWLFGVAFAVARIMAAGDFAVVFAGRALWLDLVTLGFLFVCFARASRGRRHSHGHRIAQVGALALVVCTVSLFLLFDGQARARASFQRNFPGPEAFVALVRGFYDFDGDGFSSILGGIDCDDGNADVRPGAFEIVGNGLDDNCLGGDLESVELPTDEPLPPPLRRNSFVFITVDTWRADTALHPSYAHLTPRFRAFAEKSAHFRKAYAQASYTDDSLRSLITGRYPMDYSDGWRRYIGQEDTFLQHFSALGYKTACLQQIWHSSPLITLGCQEFDDELAVHNKFFNGKTSALMTDKAVSAFRRLNSSDEPFALWVHYFDPHSNYLPSEGSPVSGSSRLDRYHQEVWFTDREVGRFLDEIEASGFFDQGMVVITSDHGEGNRGHGWTLEEGVLHVPLALRGTGVVPGNYDVRVSLVDLFSTILQGTTGLDVPSDGRNLASIWNGHETRDRDIFAVSYYEGIYLRTAIVNGWKLIQDLRSGSEYLYDLVSDPNERDNKVESADATLSSLRHVIGRRWDLAFNDQVLERKSRLRDKRLLDPEMLRQREREIERHRQELNGTVPSKD